MKKQIDKSLSFREKEFKLRPWQLKIQEVIYGTYTRPGKVFDILLLIIILLSVVVIMLESVSYLNLKYNFAFLTIEWIVTGLFTIEYILRIVSLRKPFSYIFSFMGLVDLFSLLPSYLSLFIDGAASLMIVRSIRFLRIFRILRLSRYMIGADVLGDALKNSRHKIAVFLISMLTIVIILGGLMYVIEPKEAGFTSIPRSVYWAIITITTVGYGDIAPVTPLGQALASFIMLFGYAIIAVPTGIVSSEFTSLKSNEIKPFECQNCGEVGHEKSAHFCKSCGYEF
ncbi:ion transporter [Brumimicrobium glaciale]|jgi:voltage-gated potassium channel|uniref:Ion transporter n=1 Tax=Brumimicrobium glaciale TaxID=200475 RepID=A0A4Q4KPL8_9FLAO|nr:ion transporter [Brumimicrobium glaciale]RYM33949.1 ion transporter [Brumimicrobium glaciale]